MKHSNELRVLNEEIVACRACPRLVAHREKVAREKRRAFRSETYWGRPVPGFGDPEASLLIVGLAPAAHGANRTGRMFTGDRSGEFLYARLFEAGFGNQAESKHRGDGLELRNAYLGATARCAPPGNKPLPGEIANCRGYLEREFGILRPRAVLALGKIAFDVFIRMMADAGRVRSRKDFVFRHGARYFLSSDNVSRNIAVFAAYHPSQQNTQTGRVTPAMYRRVLRDIRRFLCAQR